MEIFAISPRHPLSTPFIVMFHCQHNQVGKQHSFESFETQSCLNMMVGTSNGKCLKARYDHSDKHLNKKGLID